MKRLAFFALALTLGLTATVRADHFTIDLAARAAKEPKPAAAVYPAPDAKPRARDVLTAGADARITVSWTLRNGDSPAPVKDVLVHFFVVKQDRPDQAEVPKLTRNVVIESALTMDFKAQDKTEGAITFTVAQPGCYLIRLELKNAGGKDGREPFAAIDLVAR